MRYENLFKKFIAKYEDPTRTFVDLRKFCAICITFHLNNLSDLTLFRGLHLITSSVQFCLIVNYQPRQRGRNLLEIMCIEG